MAVLPEAVVEAHDMTIPSGSATDPYYSEPRRHILKGLLLSTGALSGAHPASAAVRDSKSLLKFPALQTIPIPKQKAAREALASVGDASLWYWDTGGTGTPLVLLHPMTGSGLVWPYQQPVFAGAGHRVIGYSRRGFHNSEPGPKDHPGTGAQDLSRLLDALHIDKFHAVASAAGAFVAADFAVSFPERLSSLVLACSNLGIQDTELAALKKDLLPPRFEELPAAFQELSPSYRAINQAGAARWVELQQLAIPGDRIVQPLLNDMSLDSLRRIATPTLLISGDADLFAPPPLGRLFAARIPHCELQIFPECGHSAYWERPDLFNQSVLDFIARQ
jgi:pimeloyl-ACP methyl ester carboxylesterase